MEKRMRNSLAAYLVLATGAALFAQDPGMASPYTGTSNPPQDDILVSPTTQPLAKPSPGRPLNQPQSR